MSKVNTIIFDCSDVLIKGLVRSERHLRKFSREITAEDFFMSELDDLFLGKISEDKYWKIVIKKNTWDISIEELKRAARNNFKEIKGMRKILEKLRQNGYKLGLLSNHAKEWVQYCELTYNYHKLFHKIVYSYEVGLSKPNKDIFLNILKKLRANPEECLFIDDNIKNVTTAQELGFNVIQFNSAKDLKKQFKRFKIKL